MKRKMGTRIEAPNLKRFRGDVKELLLEKASTGGPNAPAGANAKGADRKQRRRMAKLEKKKRIRDFQLKKQGKAVEVEEEKKKEGKKKTKKKKKKKNKKEEGKEEEDETEAWKKEAEEIRARQLKAANEEEDKIIRQLEKNLGIKKKKRGEEKMPNSFKADGLDYLLELCREDGVGGEGMLEEDEEVLGSEKEDDIDDGEISDDIVGEDSEDDDEEDDEGVDDEDDVKMSFKDLDGDDQDDEDENDASTSSPMDAEPVETFEDIYGRIRDANTKRVVKDNLGVPAHDPRKTGAAEKAASVEAAAAKAAIGGGAGKYVPPSLRGKSSSDSSENRVRIFRQIKGLMNRLSEANVLSIVTGLEDIYNKNSRNEVTTCLTDAVMTSCVFPSQSTPSRFLLEHALLVGALHQVVGAEVGAEILERAAKMVQTFLQESAPSIDDKRIDNAVGLLCGLYIFKVVHSRLLFDLVQRVAQRFGEKDVEVILIVFRSVGFYLRKDDPSELKARLTDLQRRAAEFKSRSAESSSTGFSKVQFMLDILLAVKNNNMTKIPNYDVETPERMSKVLKSILSAKKSSKGENSLRLTLSELADAESKGKWWIVGGAWEGNQAGAADASAAEADKRRPEASDETLARVEKLAAKQRINTKLRKSIFTVLLTADDYVEAFRNLLKLNLNEKQEREIVAVLGSACLHEKEFNKYYGFLAQKFCDFHQRFRVTFKYWLWDMYREVSNLPARRAVNLAELFAHLILQGGLSLSALKILEFGVTGGVALTFAKTLTRRVLLAEDECLLDAAFGKIADAPKLAVLRQSLLLFMRHFLVVEEEEESGKLQERLERVEKYLKKR